MASQPTERYVSFRGPNLRGRFFARHQMLVDAFPATRVRLQLHRYTSTEAYESPRGSPPMSGRYGGKWATLTHLNIINTIRKNGDRALTLQFFSHPPPLPCSTSVTDLFTFAATFLVGQIPLGQPIPRIGLLRHVRVKGDTELPG